MKPKQEPEEQPKYRDDEAVEARVKQMLDPSVPDPEPKKPAFEVIKETDEEPATAPTLDAEVPAKPEAVKPQTQPAPKADKTMPAEDAVIDKAVDDIRAQESDELLKTQDEEIAKAFDGKKPGLKQRVKNAVTDWWHNKRRRNLTLAGVAAVLVATLTIPTSRYFLLNNVGVRAAASVIVLDESTSQPLRNVRVSLRGQTATTDQDGYVKLEHLKLGTTELTVERRAFASASRKVTLGWGSNPLGDFKLTPVGSQYAFRVTDFLSGQPIDKVEAISGIFSAFSDADGLIKLTVDDGIDETFEVTLKKDGYRLETISVPADSQDEQAVAMAPSRRHVFISRRSGKFDVYKIDADGKNEAMVLAGTGSERDDMVLVPHPTNEVVALVSTRGNERNADGFLLSQLTLIDLSDDSTEQIAQSERLQIVGWTGDYIVYVRITAGASAAKPDRHRLISFNYKTRETVELAQSNYFNSAIMAKGLVYYAPSSAYQTKPVALYRVNADGTDRQAVLEQETWNIFRTAYDVLTMSVGQDWYEYHINNNSNSKLDGQPADLSARVYVDSPDKTRSLWVDQRDGKGVLLTHNIETGEDKVLHTQSGLKTPIRWLSNNTAVFRIGTDSETADYVISLDGGEPKKIRDVTNTSGIDRWYYY